MRVFLAALLAAIVIAGAATPLLDHWQRSADSAFASRPNASLSHRESGHCRFCHTAD